MTPPWRSSCLVPQRINGFGSTDSTIIDADMAFVFQGLDHLEGFGDHAAERERLREERRAVEDQILYPDERDAPINETIEVRATSHPCFTGEHRVIHI